jgi:hypothetical protein
LTSIDTKTAPKVLPAEQAPSKTKGPEKTAPAPAAPAASGPPKDGPAPWRHADLPPDAEIVILFDTCPRQPQTKAADHWMQHIHGKKQTVAQLVAGGGEISRLRTDIKRGSLRLGVEASK